MHKTFHTICYDEKKWLKNTGIKVIIDQQLSAINPLRLSDAYMHQ